MSWSFKLIRVAGIDVKIHVTFFLLLLYFGWLGFNANGIDNGGYRGAVVSIGFVLLLFLCVVLHEFGHSLMARRFGIRTPDITLLPIGGVARLERMPESARQEFFISLAGPAVNVAIALVLAPFVLDFSDPNHIVLDLGNLFLGGLLYINLFLVAFNMIPAFPMDGGRVLRAGLQMFLPRLRATTIAARIGQVLAVCFVLWAFRDFANPRYMLMLIGFFIFSAAGQELRGVRFMETTGRRRVGDVMTTRFDTIPQHHSREEIVAFARSHGQTIFPVMDGSMRVAGIVSRDDILNPASLASSLGMVRPVPAITAETPAIVALQTMQASGEPILPVVNHSGQIVGMVTAAALTEG